MCARTDRALDALEITLTCVKHESHTLIHPLAHQHVIALYLGVQLAGD